MTRPGSRPARMVCGVGRSSNGRAVAELSQTLSDALGAELVLVHVVESSNPRNGAPPLPFDPATYRAGALERGAVLLQESVGPALAGGARGRVEIGDPVSRLLHVATDESASLLVLTSPLPADSEDAIPSGWSIGAEMHA